MLNEFGLISKYLNLYLASFHILKCRKLIENVIKCGVRFNFSGSVFSQINFAEINVSLF